MPCGTATVVCVLCRKAVSRSGLHSHWRLAHDDQRRPTVGHNGLLRSSEVRRRIDAAEEKGNFHGASHKDQT